MPAAIDLTIATIEKQHQDILGCCTRLLEAIESGTTGQISDRRVRLSALLHANLITEETVLNGPMHRLPVWERPAGYRELAAEASKLRLTYSQHVGRWTLSAIAANRGRYADDALALIVAVQQHLNKKSVLIRSWGRLLKDPALSNYQDQPNV